MINLEQITMELSDDEKSVLYRYTLDLSIVENMSHHDYLNSDGKKISQLLDDYHVVWFHTKPGDMFLIPRD